MILRLVHQRELPKGLEILCRRRVRSTLAPIILYTYADARLYQRAQKFRASLAVRFISKTLPLRLAAAVCSPEIGGLFRGCSDMVPPLSGSAVHRRTELRI